MKLIKVFIGLILLVLIASCRDYFSVTNIKSDSKAYVTSNSSAAYIKENGVFTVYVQANGELIDILVYRIGENKSESYFDILGYDDIKPAPYFGDSPEYNIYFTETKKFEIKTTPNYYFRYIPHRYIHLFDYEFSLRVLKKVYEEDDEAESIMGFKVYNSVQNPITDLTVVTPLGTVEEYRCAEDLKKKPYTDLNFGMTEKYQWCNFVKHTAQTSGNVLTRDSVGQLNVVGSIEQSKTTFEYDTAITSTSDFDVYIYDTFDKKSAVDIQCYVESGRVTEYKRSNTEVTYNSTEKLTPIIKSSKNRNLTATSIKANVISNESPSKTVGLIVNNVSNESDVFLPYLYNDNGLLLTAHNYATAKTEFTKDCSQNFISDVKLTADQKKNIQLAGDVIQVVLEFDKPLRRISSALSESSLTFIVGDKRVAAKAKDTLTTGLSNEQLEQGFVSGIIFEFITTEKMYDIDGIDYAVDSEVYLDKSEFSLIQSSIDVTLPDFTSTTLSSDNVTIELGNNIVTITDLALDYDNLVKVKTSVLPAKLNPSKGYYIDVPASYKSNQNAIIFTQLLGSKNTLDFKVQFSNGVTDIDINDFKLVFERNLQAEILSVTALSDYLSEFSQSQKHYTSDTYIVTVGNFSGFGEFKLTWSDSAEFKGAGGESSTVISQDSLTFDEYPGTSIEYGSGAPKLTDFEPTFVGHIGTNGLPSYYSYRLKFGNHIYEPQESNFEVTLYDNNGDRISTDDVIVPPRVEITHKASDFLFSGEFQVNVHTGAIQLRQGDASLVGSVDISFSTSEMPIYSKYGVPNGGLSDVEKLNLEPARVEALSFVDINSKTNKFVTAMSLSDTVFPNRNNGYTDNDIANCCEARNITQDTSLPINGAIGKDTSEWLLTTDISRAKHGDEVHFALDDSKFPLFDYVNREGLLLTKGEDIPPITVIIDKQAPALLSYQIIQEGSNFYLELVTDEKLHALDLSKFVISGDANVSFGKMSESQVNSNYMYRVLLKPKVKNRNVSVLFEQELLRDAVGNSTSGTKSIDKLLLVPTDITFKKIADATLRENGKYRFIPQLGDVPSEDFLLVANIDDSEDPLNYSWKSAFWYADCSRKEQYGECATRWVHTDAQQGPLEIPIKTKYFESGTIYDFYVEIAIEDDRRQNIDSYKLNFYVKGNSKQHNYQKVNKLFDVPFYDNDPFSYLFNTRRCHNFSEAEQPGSRLGVKVKEGSSCDIGVTLTAAPMAPFNVQFQNEHPYDKGYVSSPSLYFDKTNWNVEQTIKIEHPDDEDNDRLNLYMPKELAGPAHEQIRLRNYMPIVARVSLTNEKMEPPILGESSFFLNENDHELFNVTSIGKSLGYLGERTDPLDFRVSLGNDLMFHTAGCQSPYGCKNFDVHKFEVTSDRPDLFEIKPSKFEITASKSAPSYHDFKVFMIENDVEEGKVVPTIMVTRQNTPAKKLWYQSSTPSKVYSNYVFDSMYDYVNMVWQYFEADIKERDPDVAIQFIAHDDEADVAYFNRIPFEMEERYGETSTYELEIYKGNHLYGGVEYELVSDLANIRFEPSSFLVDEAGYITIKMHVDDDTQISGATMANISLVPKGNDALYPNADLKPISRHISFVDDDQFGYDIASKTDFVIDEGGVSSLAVKLKSDPNGEVEISVGTESALLTALTSSLSFNENNWFQYQEVRLQAREDLRDNDTKTHNINLALANEIDSSYQSKLDEYKQSLSVAIPYTVIDNDTYELVQSFETGLLEQTDNNFIIQLTAPPPGNFSLKISTGDPDLLTFSGSEDTILNFTPENWEEGLLAPVTLADDDDKKSKNITIISKVVSQDFDDVYGYLDRFDGQIQFTIRDDDTPSIEVKNVLTDNTTLIYDVKLGSKPKADVVLDFITPTSKVFLAQPLMLRFNDSNWDTYQRLTIKSVLPNDGYRSALGDLSGSTETKFGLVVDTNRSSEEYNGFGKYFWRHHISPFGHRTSVSFYAHREVTEERYHNSSSYVGPIVENLSIIANQSFTTENGGSVILSAQLNDRVKDYLKYNNHCQISSYDSGSIQSMEFSVSVLSDDAKVIGSDTLTWTKDNWDEVKPIGIKGYSDNKADGTQDYFVLFKNTKSVRWVCQEKDDPMGAPRRVTERFYSSFLPWVDPPENNSRYEEDEYRYSGGAIKLTSIDIEQITLSGISDSINEDSGTHDLYVGITSQPYTDITLDIVSDSDLVSFEPSTINISNENFMDAQKVVMTVKDDSIVQTDREVEVKVKLAEESEIYYSAPPQTKTLTIKDDDIEAPDVSPALVVSNMSGNTSESGATASFTVKLATQPSGAVEVGVSIFDFSEAEVDTYSLFFSPDNWDQVQTVTVTGQDDDEVDGDVEHTIMLEVGSTSAATEYWFVKGSVTVVNEDND